jgi:hypothetical protein
LTDKHLQLVTVFEMAPVGACIAPAPGLPGRPAKDRVALARTFIAKSVHGIQTTSMLIERLQADGTLLRLCGWRHRGELPSEATFSRAFAEFAASELPHRVHEALIRCTHEERLVGHICRDSTAIVVREKPVKLPRLARRRKIGRPRKGEVVVKHVRRIERQASMSLGDMLADLPKHCSVGIKINAKGRRAAWIGYKLHIDTADGDIPVSCLLTTASLHDSQAAIPLATMTARRLTNLYDLMDSAYYAADIIAHSRALGHVPIIPVQPGKSKTIKAQLAAESLARRHANHTPAEAVRYRQRTASERVNGRLKEEFGGNHVRVRGHAKVACHLMFGILALTVDQLMRFVT